MFYARLKKPSVLTVFFMLMLGVLSLTPSLVSAAVTTYTNNTAVNITDNSTVTSTLAVPDAVTINDLDVALNITHTFVGDLIVQLQSPGGTTITLVDRPGRTTSGFGFGSDNIITTLDDESAGGPVENANPPTGASYTPQEPLSGFDGQNAQGTWTLTVSDNAGGDIGTLNSWSLLVDDGATTGGGSTPTTVVINDDPDGDGLPTGQDNCPMAHNPDQEDGWGSAMGDDCDTEWYNRVGQGISGFVQKDSMFHLHGNCVYMADGQPRCPVIAAFDPTTFDPAAMPMEITSADAGGWIIWVYYLHSSNGEDVYQVNVYNGAPMPETLVDDRLEIHVSGGSWYWWHRGGDSQYQGGSHSGSGDGAGSDSKG